MGRTRKKKKSRTNAVTSRLQSVHTENKRKKDTLKTLPWGKPSTWPKEFLIFDRDDVENYPNQSEGFAFEGDHALKFFHRSGREDDKWNLEIDLEATDDVVVQIVQKPFVHSSSVSFASGAMREPEFLRDVPYNVVIRTNDGDTSFMAHQFILMVHSSFFRAKFRRGGGYELKGRVNASDSMDTVIIDHPMATKNIISIIIDAFYGIWPKNRFLPLSTILALLYVCDYLGVNDWLIGIWRTALTFGIGKPDYAIKIFKVAEQLQLKSMMSAPLKWLKCRTADSPMDKGIFSKLSLDYFMDFLRRPEDWSENVHEVHNVYGLPAIAREEFIFDLAVKYLKANRQYLCKAGDIFKCIRLCMINLASFQSVLTDLPELALNVQIPAMFHLADQHREEHIKKADLNCHGDMCRPRNDSVKCFFWSQKVNCNINCHCWTECHRPFVNFKVEPILMIRNGSVKITGIGAAFRRYKESMALSAICLQWSDGGTTDYSPGWFATEEENRYWIDLKNGERITPKVSASNSFIESLQYKVLRDKKSLPEKGDWNVQGKSVDMCSYKKVVSHQELYRTTFFDGLKANAIYMTDKDDPDDDLPIITELQFKMSTFVYDGCGRFVWQQPMRDVDAECDEDDLWHESKWSVFDDR